VLGLICDRNFDGVVAIYDSNWYIKRLNNIEIDKQLLDLSVPQYHYGGREASPTHTGNLQSLLLNTKS
jgi:hypothetical protein